MTAGVAVGGRRGPSPLRALVEPRALFADLREQPVARRAMVWLAWSTIVLPLATGVMSYPTLRAAFAADPALAGKSGLVPFLAALMALVTCLVQAAMLGMHLVVFTAAARWLGARGDTAAIRAVWAYALVPLIVRQLFYLVVIAVQGVEWFRQRAGVLAFADPFMIFVAVLLYLGCRQVLDLSRRQAVLASLSATFIGALGALTKLVG